MTISPGTRLGPYEIISPIGAGGMGEVFLGRDTRLDRSVAIKVLPSHLSSNPQFRERFDREARAVSALNHPNICTLHDVGHQDGVDYIVMELLEGESLADRLIKGALPIEQVLRYGVQIAEGLDKAHRQGIVHRDLKPANVMITKSGAKLLDFGLAKSVTDPSAVSSATNMATAQKPLTQEGTILGTFQYMAPEQLEGEEADARTDIFALGALLYEMVTGKRAFAGKTKTSLIAAIVSSEPAPISQIQPLTPPALEHVIRKCLAKDRDDRWQSAHDIAGELRWISEERLQRAPEDVSAGKRRLPPTAIIGFLIIVLAVITTVVWRWRAAPSRGSATPVIVLMDSTHPLRVYDPQTLKNGGTNADDLTDLLSDLPVTLVKENTSWAWHRENEVLRQNPAIILIHRSSFYAPSGLGNDDFERDFYARANDKLEMFIGYIGTTNPRTKFLIYSRRSWKDAPERDRWVVALGNRFPPLKGRVQAWMVPLDRATFRNPKTGAEMKRDVIALLGLKR